MTPTYTFSKIFDCPPDGSFTHSIKPHISKCTKTFFFILQFDGNAERIIEELNKKSNQLHNEEPQRYLPPIPLDQFSGQEYLEPPMNMSHSRQQSYNVQQGQYHQTLPTPTSRDLETQTLECSYYAGGHGQDYDRYYNHYLIIGLFTLGIMVVYKIKPNSGLLYNKVKQKGSLKYTY